MKKIMITVIAVMMLLSLAACGNSGGSSAPAPGNDNAGGAASSAVIAPSAAGAEDLTINLLGEDVPVKLELGDGTFTAAYSFNGNDVVANGTIDASGMMTVTDYTPEDVPEMYVQGAIDLIAEEIAE